MEKPLLDEIRRHLGRTGMSAAYFGKRSCGNTQIVKRLERGHTVTLRTAARIRAFIEERERDMERVQ